jgi:diguanylate cyclase (GGDEF)-like protein
MSLLHDMLHDHDRYNSHLTCFFQAVVDFEQQCNMGYECLVRGPVNTPLHTPLALFAQARQDNQVAALQALCLRSALFHAQRLQLKHSVLFVNVDAAVVHEFPLSVVMQTLEQYQWPPDKLVLELGGAYPEDNLDILKQIVQTYRAAGMSVALDNMGRTQDDLLLWSELNPDYVKIDRYFCAAADTSLRKQSFLRMFYRVALDTNTRLIAHGVETEACCQTLSELGFRFAQGFYFAKPQASPALRLPVRLYHTQAPAKLAPRSANIACLITESPCIFPAQSVESVGELFHQMPEICSLPVVNSAQVPIGIVRRYDLMQLLLGRYGRELHGRKPVQSIMDKDALIFDVNMTLEDASRQLTAQARVNLEYDFIITENGNYRGLGKVMDLLRRMTELQMRNARYANPLTLLPGNVPIQEHLEILLRKRCRFVVAYCDLDNFKPFNDVYGYNRGDDVIKAVARVLTEHTVPAFDFVGHVGGDDFIAVLRSQDWEKRMRAVLDDFDALAQTFYSAEHRQQGGIYTQDRQGQTCFFHFVSLSIGIVQPDSARCHSHHDIALLASDAKHHAKHTQGSCLFIERRQGPS